MTSSSAFVQRPESLLTPTGIKLYGKEFKPFTVGNLSDLRPKLGANNFLRGQLEANDARFARIYGFSFEGCYYDLPNPAIFLVHGPGELASPEGATGTTKGGSDTTLKPGSSTTTMSGVAAKDWEFSSDIRFWGYDKGDFSMRLDIETGPFEQILLGLSASDAAYSGANVSGANVRGANARGANVRGANVRGANARGGNSD